MLLIDFAIIMLLNLLFFGPIILVIALIKEGGPEGLLRSMGFIKKPGMAPPSPQEQSAKDRLDELWEAHKNRSTAADPAMNYAMHVASAVNSLSNRVEKLEKEIAEKEGGSSG